MPYFENTSRQIIARNIVNAVPESINWSDDLRLHAIQGLANTLPQHNPVGIKQTLTRELVNGKAVFHREYFMPDTNGRAFEDVTVEEPVKLDVFGRFFPLNADKLRQGLNTPGERVIVEYNIGSEQRPHWKTLDSFSVAMDGFNRAEDCIRRQTTRIHLRRITQR
jgi:hypothetical protein